MRISRRANRSSGLPRLLRPKGPLARRSLSALVALVALAGARAAAGQAPAADAVASPRPAAPERTWPSFTGSGLITIPDTSTVPPGRVELSLGIDNRDRDPLKMDVVDLDAVWTIGVARRLETYGHVVLARAVTVSPRGSLFPSPIDLVVPEGQPVPQRPYYPIYSAHPYVSRRGTSQLGRFNLGEAVLGVKRTLWTPRGARPGLALSGEVKLPLTRALINLQSGSGTGGIDERVRLTSEWGGGRRSLVASISYSHLGAGAWGDRLITYRPSGEATATDHELHLPGTVALGAGFRQVLTPRAALVVEATKLREVGGRTPAFRTPGPVDITAGVHLRWRSVGALLCARYHANSIREREYDWPLAGFADLGRVSNEHLVAYLQSIDAASVLQHLRRGSHTALALPANAPPLPPEGRMLPPGFTVGPHGNKAYVFLVTWTLGAR
jgi:hypothetical protein